MSRTQVVESLYLYGTAPVAVTVKSFKRCVSSVLCSVVGSITMKLITVELETVRKIRYINPPTAETRRHSHCASFPRESSSSYSTLLQSAPLLPCSHHPTPPPFITDPPSTPFRAIARRVPLYSTPDNCAFRSVCILKRGGAVPVPVPVPVWWGQPSGARATPRLVSCHPVLSYTMLYYAVQY